MKIQTSHAGYVYALIKDQTTALALIDNTLLKFAKTEQVIAHLNETRKHVAMHLEEAKQLKKNR